MIEWGRPPLIATRHVRAAFDALLPEHVAPRFRCAAPSQHKLQLPYGKWSESGSNQAWGRRRGMGRDKELPGARLAGTTWWRDQCSRPRRGAIVNSAWPSSGAAISQNGHRSYGQTTCSSCHARRRALR